MLVENAIFIHDAVGSSWFSFSSVWFLAVSHQLNSRYELVEQKAASSPQTTASPLSPSALITTSNKRSVKLHGNRGLDDFRSTFLCKKINFHFSPVI